MSDPDEPERLGAITARGVRLADAVPELTAQLDATERSAVSEMLLPTVVLDAGPWSLRGLGTTAGVHGPIRGFLVLSGAVTADLAIASQVCTRLITPTELVLLDGWEDDSIPVSTGWGALQPTRLALFDDRLKLIAGRFPGLMDELLKRAAQQIRHALLQQAISQLPRVEERLLALMWSIADRQGRVGTDGVTIELAAGHEVLAQMIGARRPTVSLGLKALAEAGFVTREGDQWRLAPESIYVFPRPATRPEGAFDGP